MTRTCFEFPLVSFTCRFERVATTEERGQEGHHGATTSTDIGQLLLLLTSCYKKLLLQSDLVTRSYLCVWIQLQEDTFVSGSSHRKLLLYLDPFTRSLI